MNFNDNPFIFETKLSGALIGDWGVMEVDFNTEFPTWIIAYCVDTNSWFCTNKRFFYYEYPKEFKCEKDAVEYFRNNVCEFFELSREMHPKKIGSIFLENELKEYDKDYKAYMNAEDRYVENIQELATCDIPYKLLLTNIDYDLEAALIHFKNRDLE